MKNVIIGTAGHIDHGKTTLIKALTGTDTDRLKEEKKRGITIELGFTHFDLPSGKRAGIIDVPGHERFIKNMLAGVGGIDIVLLVIAADEGVMPQTQEHLDILSILEVKKGIIVLSKADLVDGEWLELVKEEIKESVKDTFLSHVPMIPVSAVTGEGLDELVRTIDKMTDVTEERNTGLPSRLSIDRIFTKSGFGTVITGTLIEGIIHEGDTVTVYPRKLQTKVRNIQVHGQTVDTAYAGQRVAINLANIKKEDIQRGDVVAANDSMQPTMMLDVKVNLLKNSHRILDNRERLRFYHGTSEILCRMVLLDREELKPGESCYAQLRLEDETVAKRNDHFVIRFYSPMETIGGGIVLEPNPSKHKRFKEDTLEELKIKEEGSTDEVVEKIIKRFSHKFENIRFYVSQTGLSEVLLTKIIEDLIAGGSVVKFGNNIVLHRSFLEKIEETMMNVLNEFHKKNPLRLGMLKEELRNKTVPDAKGKLFDEILRFFCEVNTIKVYSNHICLFDFEIEYTDGQKKIMNEIEKKYLENGFTPPTLEELLKQCRNEKEYRQVFSAMVEMSKIVKISEEIYIHQDYLHKAVEMIKNYLQENKEITLSQFRDLIGTTRKYALPLLEYLDQNKITKRIEDKRVLF
ncbi:MAG: selenocysteine-specific translation elongation factor [Bacillota bacterium]